MCEEGPLESNKKFLIKLIQSMTNFDKNSSNSGVATLAPLADKHLIGFAPVICYFDYNHILKISTCQHTTATSEKRLRIDPTRIVPGTERDGEGCLCTAEGLWVQNVICVVEPGSMQADK